MASWMYHRMRSTGSHVSGYVLAAAMGAIGGGLVVAVATKAIPRMMSQMMQNMMANKGDGEFSSAEI